MSVIIVSILFLLPFSLAFAAEIPAPTQPLDLLEKAQSGVSEREALERLKTYPSEPAPYIVLGASAIRQGKLDLSRGYLLRALDLDPRNAEAHEQLGINYAKRQTSNGALAEMKTAVEIDPENPDYHYNLGALYYNSHNYPEALIQFRRALELRPGNSDYQFAVASTFEADKRLDEAEAEFTRLLRDHPNLTRAHCALANTLLVRGDLAEAEKHLKKAIELRPSYGDAYYLLGKVQEKQGQAAAALQSYLRVCELEPSHLNAHYQLSLLYSRLGKQEEAQRQQAIFQSLKSRVDSVNFLILGTNFLRASKYPLAHENFTHAIESDPQNAQALYYLGLVLQQEGDLPKALEAYQKALAVNPRVAIVQAETGLLLAEMSRAEDARPYLERALELGKDDYGVNLAAGRAFLLGQDYARAEDSLLRALQLWPSQPPVLVNLFLLYAHWGKKQQAGRYARLAVEASPRDPGVCYEAGVFWLKLNDYAEARQALEKAAALNPGDAATRLQLAWAYFYLRQNSFAQESVSRHLQLMPNSGEGHYLNARLWLAQGDPTKALDEARLASDLSPQEPEVFLLLSQIYEQLGRNGEADAARQHYREVAPHASGNKDFDRKLSRDQ